MCNSSARSRASNCTPRIYKYFVPTALGAFLRPASCPVTCRRFIAARRHRNLAQISTLHCFPQKMAWLYQRTLSASRLPHQVTMLLKPLAILDQATPYPAGRLSPRRRFTVADSIGELLHGIQRRWQRERRRRKVGRAYDMALEIAPVMPRHSRMLDVGGGNGFIAHHLSAMLGTEVTGIDLDESAQAPINYLRFDGAYFPVEEQSF